MRAPGARFLRTGLIVALFCLSPLLPLPHVSEIVSAASTALQPYGLCAPPPQEGINFCVPARDPYTQSQDMSGDTMSPFQVIAAGTSGRGQVNNMQLWADGKKILQTPGSPMDADVTLPPGLHELTVIEVDETGFYAKSRPRMVNVQAIAPEACAPPESPGVHICNPTGQCEPWLEVSAAARGETGPVVRMEIWEDGAKLANFSGDHFSTYWNEPEYWHGGIYGVLEVWEVDSHSHALKSYVQMHGVC
jgi:hypothetical protein